jgi:putative ABC transport system permease protein
VNELRSALRLLFRHPGFAAIAIITLALGIGATTAIFSVVHAVLVNPFPYVEGNRIAFVGQESSGERAGQMPVTWLDFLEWRKQVTRIEHLSFVSNENFLLTGVPEPAFATGAAMTASTWELLGIPAQLGRTFTEADDHASAEPVAVLSHAGWQRMFAGASDVIGRTVELDDVAHTVIGVMPPEFKFWAADVWTPIGLKSRDVFMQNRLFRNSTWVVGRLAPEASVADADQELDLISARIEQEHPETNKGVSATVRLLRDSAGVDIRDALLVLFAAAGCLLLIACVNVANLVLAKAAAREREFGIRSALGASPRRLLRQVLIENLPLALFGCGAGVLVAVGSLEAVLLLIPTGLVPAESQIELNLPVLLFALSLAFMSTVVFGAIAAFGRATSASPEALREGAGGTANRRTQRLRAGLVVAEVAIALTLLVGAGLLLRSFERLQRVDLGFEIENLLAVPLRLPETTFSSGDQATLFYRELIERVRTLPGIAAAGASQNAPLMTGSGLPLLVEGEQYTDLNQLRGVQFSLVMGDYFAAQGIELKRGRLVSDADRAGSEPVVVLNEAAVRQFLPGRNPLGQRVMVGMPEHLIQPGMLPEGLDSFHWATVVGLVADVRHFGPASDPPPAAYLPIDQSWNHPAARNGMIVTLRSEGDPMALASAVREIVRALNPDQPVQALNSTDQLLWNWMRPARFNAVLVRVFAGLALLLSAIGIYGVVAWSVAQRVREVGVRIALGASRGNVLGQVIRQGMRAVLLGVAIGLIGAAGAANLIQGMLFQVGTLDPWTFIAVALLLILVALLACWLPARRAAGTDPMVALRGG